MPKPPEGETEGAAPSPPAPLPVPERAPRPSLADDADEESAYAAGVIHAPNGSASDNDDASSEDEGNGMRRLDELLAEVEAALQTAEVLPDHVSAIRADRKSTL